MFKKIGFEPSSAAKLNLRRMDSIDWVNKHPALINEGEGALGGEDQLAKPIAPATATSEADQALA